MNAYEKRRRQATLRRKFRSDDSRAYKYAEINWRLDRYTNAYTDLYKKPGIIKYKKGWYWIHNQAYRASQVDSICNDLEVQIHIRDNPPPEEDDG